MSRLPDSMPLREALRRFYREHGLGPDGGYNSRWVRIRIAGPVSIYFPNTSLRKRSLLVHDLHHIATGYPTNLRGEAEIAGWEIGGGCGDHVAAWVLNTMALGYGMVLMPRLVWRAFVRGRRSGSLYHERFKEEILDLTVGGLRERLRLDRAPERARAGDVGALAIWYGCIVGAELVGIALVVWGVVWLAGVAG